MKLFYDDEFDAIARPSATAASRSRLVAAHMFPDMKPESAYARLKACCSPTGDQRLTFGQVVRLMNVLRVLRPAVPRLRRNPARAPGSQGTGGRGRQAGGSPERRGSDDGAGDAGDGALEGSRRHPGWCMSFSSFAQEGRTSSSVPQVSAQCNTTACRTFAVSESF
jgi:hypothetical protein